MKTTDELIDMIIAAGAPLPEYSYDYRKFTAEFLTNEMVGDVHIGKICESFSTFREACIWILERSDNWHNENPLNEAKP